MIKIVGSVVGEEEAFELEDIAKISIIGERSRYLGNIAQMESLREALYRHEEAIKEIDEFLDNNSNQNKEPFFRKLIFEISKAIRPK